MKKIVSTLSFLILLITNAFADKCYNSDTTPVILDSEKKPGRFFEDQPDVNDDYQVHIIYMLLKDSKDKEEDKTDVSLEEVSEIENNKTEEADTENSQ